MLRKLCYMRYFYLFMHRMKKVSQYNALDWGRTDTVNVNNKTRMLISIVSRLCMNDIIIIDHVLFTHQLSDTKLWSKYCELK